MKSMMMAVAMGLVVGATTMVSAKELASGGAAGGVVATACSPIKAISAKGDAKVGETGVGSVQFGWSVAPCDKTRPVIVAATISDYQKNLTIYADIDAGLSGKVIVAAASGRAYLCTISVYDATTGALLGTQSVYASTKAKPGV